MKCQPGLFATAFFTPVESQASVFNKATYVEQLRKKLEGKAEAESSAAWGGWKITQAH